MASPINPTVIISFPRQIIGIVLLLLSLLSFNVFADANSGIPPTTGKVIFGAYVNGIHSIDLKNGTVDLDLYVWFRTKGKKNLLDSLEIMNGSMGEKTSILKKKIGDEMYYSMRIATKAYQLYDLRSFPLDHQQLIFSFEDSEEDVSALQFEPDKENTKISGSIALPGWKVGQVKIDVNMKEYDTNYGDISMGERHSKFSRATLTIPIDREGVGYFFKLFWAVFLSAGVAFLSLFIKPDNLDPRFGLGVGGIFAVVASSIVISSMLPETQQVTMGEVLLIMTITSIFITLIESVVSLRLWESGKQSASIKLDTWFGRIAPISYVAGCMAVVGFFID